MIYSHDRDAAHIEGYEYIVVGSGPGGGPLAANLARHGHKVLLLEAGDDQGENLNEKVPLFFAAASEDPTMRWDYFVKHYSDEKQAAKDPKMTWVTPNGAIFVGLNPPAGSKQKGIYYPRAGTLGGCATHNALIAILPHDDDWRFIAELTGDESWEPKRMRKFFERLERNHYLPEGTKGHGFHGWLETEHPDPSYLESNALFLRSAVEAVNAKHTRGSKSGPVKGLIPDVNSIHPQRVDGVYEITLQMSQDGRRSSPRNFLVATANAKNPDGSKKYPLYIRTHSLATKVLFDEYSSNPRAVGVEFEEGASLYAADPRFNSSRRGIKKCAIASREVIIAGGAFNTPQLLKLSGIGPRLELEKFDIPVVVDLPGVGTNLQDNYEFGVVAESPEVFSLLKTSNLGLAGDPLLEQWVKGQGPYKGNTIAAGVLKSSSVSEGNDEDLFLFGGPLNFTGFFPGYSRSSFGTGQQFTWDILKVHPKNNSGIVTLRSKSPHDTPNINFKYFDKPHRGDDFNDPDQDLDAMAEGVKLARKIFDGVGNPIGPLSEQAPGKDVNTRAEIKKAIRDEAFGHHASSTCAIGSDNDPMACLDSRFRVRGVENLRVVDASTFPRVPGSFPTLPIYMISEKATDVILEDIRLDDAVLDGVLDDEVLDVDVQGWPVVQETKYGNGKRKASEAQKNGGSKKTRYR